MRRLVLVLSFVLMAARVFAQDSLALDKLYLGTAGCVLRAGSGSPEGAVTGAVCDTYLQSNTADLWTKISGTGNTGWSLMPRVEAANIWTTGQTISGTEAYLYLYESDQGANLKRWRWNATGGTLALQTVDDAGSSVLATPISVTRTGVTTLTGRADISSTAPSLNLYESDRGADAKFTRWIAENEQILLESVNDAYSSSSTLITIARASGATTFAGSVAINGAFLTLTGNLNSDLTPHTTDLFNLGSASKLWNQAFISTLNATVFQQTTATLFGGYSIVGKSTGSFAADVATAATTINFGQSMTVGNWVLIRAHDTGGTIKAEYVTVGSLVSGTTYNVTRDLAAAHGTDPAWSSGTPFLVLGASGDGRIEMLAHDGKPRILFTTQGSAFNTQNDRGLIGNLNGYFGYATDIYGAAFGDPSAANITLDATNGFRVRSGTTDYAKLASGTLTIGAAAGNRLAWDGTNLTVVSQNLTINSSGVVLAASATFAADSAYRFTRPSGGFGQTGDHFGLGASSGGSIQYLELDNTAVGTGASNDADAEIILTATGWDVSAVAAIPAAKLTLKSNGGGLTTVSAVLSARDTIDFTSTITRVSAAFRTGFANDTTAYSQTDAAIVANNAGEALGVAGSTTFANLNFYIGGTTARRATLSITTGGTQGGKLAFFTKPDSAGDVAQAGYFFHDGSFVVGAPTGANKGAGTINAQAVYDDNVLLTDYVFDLFYDGRTAHRVPEYGKRLYSLAETTAAGRELRRLPWMPTRETFEQDRAVGAMIGRLWFGQEQQQLYIQQLEARITALERR